MSMIDSSTLEGWDRKTIFKEDREGPIQATMRIEVARGHEKCLMDVHIKDYSQWFPGKENDVSDALSRDDARDDDELTEISCTFIPSQFPKHLISFHPRSHKNEHGSDSRQFSASVGISI